MQDISLETFLFAAMLTFFAGFATSIGAILAFFSKKDNYFILSIGMGFSAGVMIYVSFMEILVKSRESFTNLYENPIPIDKINPDYAIGKFQSKQTYYKI